MPRLVVETDVRVAMRDGVELAADGYHSDRREPAPVLVHRTPYDRLISNFSNIPADVLRLVRDGFAVAIQDTRGRGGSAGSFAPFAAEADDGADRSPGPRPSRGRTGASACSARRTWA